MSDVPALVATSGLEIPIARIAALRRDAVGVDAGAMTAMSGAGSTYSTWLTRPNTRMLRAWARNNEWIVAALDRRREQVASSDWDILPVDAHKPFDPAVQQQILMQLRHPNPRHDSFRTLIEPVIEDYHVIGWGVIEKERTLRGDLVSLWTRDASRIQFAPGWDGTQPNAPRYFYLEQTRKVPILNDDLMVVIAHPSSDRDDGLSTLEVLKNTIDAELSGATWARDMMRHHAPSGLLHLGEDLQRNELEAFRSYWQAEIAGHSTVAITGGSKNPSWTAFNQQSGSDLIQWQLYFLRKLCAVFKLSPQDLGITFDINKATSDTQQEITHDSGLVPLLRLFEEYINREIVTCWGPPHEINLHFSFTALNDTDRRVAAELVNLQNASAPRITINEARAEDGYDPIAGGDVVVAIIPGMGVVPFLGKDVPTPAQAFQQAQAQKQQAVQAQADAAKTKAAPPEEPAPQASAGESEPPAEGAAARALGPLSTISSRAAAFPAARAGIRRRLRQAYRGYGEARTARIIADARAHLGVARAAGDRRHARAIQLAIIWAVEQEITRERVAAAMGTAGTLTAAILDAWTASVEQELGQELSALGIDRQVVLRDAALIALITQLVTKRARGIMQTLMDDTRHWSDGLDDDVDEDDALDQFGGFMTARDRDKMGVIANAETQAAAAFALWQFISRNGLEGEGRCVPTETVCQDCAEFVEQGWVSLDVAQGWQLPAHPRCPHEVETRYAPGTDTSGLWAG